MQKRNLQLTHEEALGLLGCVLLSASELTSEQSETMLKLAEFCRHAEEPSGAWPAAEAPARAVVRAESGRTCHLPRRHALAPVSPEGVKTGVGIPGGLTSRDREKTLRQYALLVEYAEDAIMGTTLEGVVTCWNPGAERLYGYSAQEAIGQPFSLLIPPDRANELPALLERLQRRERIAPYQTIYVRKDGLVVDVSISISPILDTAGQILGAAMIARDISEHQRMEEELRRYWIEGLIELEALNDRLQRAMAETHHRVKNNLQVITSLLELYVEAGSDTVPVSALTRIGRQINILAGIHDLLTQEAKTAGNIENVSIKIVLENLLRMVRETVGERRIHSEIADVRLPIKQGTALAILVNELLINAIKHGSGDSEISLVIEKHEGRLTVCDDGPGFPDGFEPHRFANTGWELIEAIGHCDLKGKVAYHNRPQGGACVVVTFPCVQPVERRGDHDLLRVDQV